MLLVQQIRAEQSLAFGPFSTQLFAENLHSCSCKALFSTSSFFTYTEPTPHHNKSLKRPWISPFSLLNHFGYDLPSCLFMEV
jgi:hypothetical protein